MNKGLIKRNNLSFKKTTKKQQQSLSFISSNALFCVTLLFKLLHLNEQIVFRVKIDSLNDSLNEPNDSKKDSFILINEF